MQGSGLNAKFHQGIVAHIRDVPTFPVIFFKNTWITTALLTKC